MDSHNGGGANDSELDGEYPLGDGVASRGATVVCPYCSETVEITLDPGSGSSQEYVEDCEICCQPWQVTVRYYDGEASVLVEALDE